MKLRAYSSNAYINIVTQLHYLEPPLCTNKNIFLRVSYFARHTGRQPWCVPITSIRFSWSRAPKTPTQQGAHDREGIMPPLSRKIRGKQDGRWFEDEEQQQHSITFTRSSSCPSLPPFPLTCLVGINKYNRVILIN